MNSFKILFTPMSVKSPCIYPFDANLVIMLMRLSQENVIMPCDDFSEIEGNIFDKTCMIKSLMMVSTHCTKYGISLWNVICHDLAKCAH